MCVNKDNIIIYIICHDEDSKQTADELIKTHYPYGKTVIVPASPYFESAVFDYLSTHYDEWVDKEWVGIITYSFHKKSGQQIDILKSIQENELSTDVITYNNLRFLKVNTQSWMTHIEGETYQHGPYLFLTILYTLKRLGYSEKQIMDKTVPSFFCNWWVAKNNWMQRYIKFVSKCKKIIEGDKQLTEYINENAYYVGNVSKETLIALTGKPYYTFHPFVFERLPAHFFSIEGARIHQYGKMGIYCL